MKNKLCFVCHKRLSDDNKISINSIAHQGYKFNIRERLKKFLSSGINSIEDYNLKIIHCSCETKIENDLMKICGDYNIKNN